MWFNGQASEGYPEICVHVSLANGLMNVDAHRGHTAIY